MQQLTEGLAAPNQNDHEIGASLQEEAATPEEQAMYEALAEPMLGLIHGKETAPKIESALKNNISIGQLTFQITGTILGQIEQEGKSVPEDILQLAAEEVVEDLVEISVLIGLVEDNEDAIEKAYVEGLMEAIELYGKQQRESGKLSPAENQQHFDNAIQLGGFDKSKVAQAIQAASAQQQEQQPQEQPPQQPQNQPAQQQGATHGI